MVGKSIDPEARRQITLRALRGESQAALAREYGISRQKVNNYVRYDKDRYKREYEYWSEVKEILRERS